VVAAIAPLALLIVVLLAPVLLRAGADRRGASRYSRGHDVLIRARRAVTRVRVGLVVFRRPQLGATAAVAQLSAWGGAPPRPYRSRSLPSCESGPPSWCWIISNT